MAGLSRAGRIRAGIAVIGLGNWGTSLAAGAMGAGIPVVEAVVRTRRRRRQGLGSLTPVLPEQAAFDAEVLWICVPDAEIASAAAAISARRSDLRGQIVVHSSGALTVGALRASRLAGARVGAIAPVFSFPTREPVRLDGVMFAVEAAADSSLEAPGEAGAVLWRRLARLARKLGGKPFRIASEQKVLYHAAATMASPLLASALQASAETARLAGLGERQAQAVVRALAEATARNFFARGANRSFSGAFARGDAATVELHLRALLEHRTLYEVYLALARNAVASLPVRNGFELERILASVDPSARGRRVRD